MARRVKTKVLDSHNRQFKEKYGTLWDYAEELKLRN